ncbi:DVU_1551 family NTP transferase [Desulfohalovibrio reitneri]|uniref:DVU_1551 family NTP transferase n=1 Tax=Desulfohalovibrio reitneri TaxID=1307759 RepID=UPI000554C311|nr:NTP transferase domain-containing protein [Desulfohalovibrio reitneri]
MPEPPRLGAIILSAGLSTRQRGFKPLLPLGDATVLEHCLRLFQGLPGWPCDTVAVLGHRADELAPLVREARARPVHNPDYKEGMFTSVQAGAAALDPEAEAFFVLPVDVPMVRPLTLTRLLWAMRERPEARAWLPAFAGRTGHPPLLRAELRAAIAAHDGRDGLRGVLEGVETAVAEVPDRLMLEDLDTPEQYERAKELWARRGIPTPGEAERLLDMERGADSEVAAHCRAVARVASALAQAVNSRSPGRIDEDLAVSGALLHDIAKGQPGHCAAGASRLAELGFSPRLCAVVAGHADHEPHKDAGVDETEVVYLADKLVRGTRVAPLDERFQAKRSAWAGDRRAVRAVDRRWDQARRIAGRVEAACGGMPPLP